MDNMQTIEEQLDELLYAFLDHNDYVDGWSADEEASNKYWTLRSKFLEKVDQYIEFSS